MTLSPSCSSSARHNLEVERLVEIQNNRNDNKIIVKTIRKHLSCVHVVIILLKTESALSHSLLFGKNLVKMLLDFQNMFELTLSQALGHTGKKEADPMAASKLNKVITCMIHHTLHVIAIYCNYTYIKYDVCLSCDAKYCAKMSSWN